VKQPTLYVIAGPNGAGKTTFARTFLPQYANCTHFVNADLIAQGLSPFSPASVALKGGRLLLEQIQGLAAKRADFAFETTLSGKKHRALLLKLKRRGYHIRLFFLWIPDVRLALTRIAQRVQEGGHYVPEPDVRRRFHRGLANLFGLYQDAVDSWSIFDNSTEKPTLIAEHQGDHQTIYDADRHAQLIRLAGRQ